MPDRESIERNRINRNMRASRSRQRELQRKRNLRLAIICVIFSIIVIFGVMFVVLNSISDKEEYREKGIKAFNAGSNDDAINYLTKSLEEQQWFSDKMGVDTSLHLGAAYIRSGKYNEAVEAYDNLRENYSGYDSKQIEGFISLAYALQGVKDKNVNEQNLDSLKKELEDGNKSVSIYLGACYELSGDYEEMLKYYNIYTEEYGMNTYIAFQLSSYYLDKNELENAEQYINQGMSCDDDLFIDRVRFNNVILSEKNIDYQGALDKMQSLLNDYPDNETFKKEYDILYSRVNIDTNPVHTTESKDE